MRGPPFLEFPYAVVLPAMPPKSVYRILEDLPITAPDPGATYPPAAPNPVS